MKIGVLGATGPAGGGVAARLASVGYDVIAGSRDPARAEAATAELVVVGTQWEAAVPTATQHAGALSGKVVVSMANGLTKVDREFRPVLPDEGSLTMAMQAAVPEARVAAA